jgi:hypothetical protein
MCQCQIVTFTDAKVTFPCLAPNVGCDWWWGISVAAFIILCVIFAWLAWRLKREFFTTRDRSGRSQCSQCGNHLAAGAHF